LLKINFSKENQRWLALTSIILIFFTIQVDLYVESIHNGDGAYVIMQMREFLAGHHSDLLHKGYNYCGILEQLFSAALSFVFPLSFSLVIGTGIYYILAFWLLRNNFARSDWHLLFAILLIPVPNIYYQSYAAAGTQTLIVFQLFLSCWVITNGRFQTEGNGNTYLCYILLGVISGFGIYSYSLALLIATSCIVCLIVFDLGKSLRTKSLRSFYLIAPKITLSGAGVSVGLLPKTLSLLNFPHEHRASGSPGLSFDWPNLVERFNIFRHTLTYIFTPIFDHSIVTSGRFNYSYYPTQAVFNHYSVFGKLIAFLFIASFTIFGLKTLIQKIELDRLNFFLLVTGSAFLSGTLLRQLSVGPEHESRLVMVLYFCIVLGVLHNAKGKISRRLLWLFWAVGIFSYCSIFMENYRFISTRQLSTKCEDMTRTEYYQLMEKLSLPALAGPNWEVWTVASFLKNRNVLDLKKQKFRHKQASTLEMPHVYISNSKVQYFSFKSRAMPHLEKSKYGTLGYESGKIGAWHLRFQKLPPDIWRNYLSLNNFNEYKNWHELINAKLEEIGNKQCRFS
jgi:hypothetical protein